MLKVVALQVFAALISVILAAFFAGWRGAASAGLGALTCVLPSLLFALWLMRSAKRHGAAQTSAFFVGEAGKVLVSIGILVLVVTLYPGVHWGTLVMGLILTLQANFFAFLVKL